MKKRILFCGEASPLHTGFSTYWREVIKRIHATGKFTIAEFGSYMASNDSRTSGIPWKFYGGTPDLVQNNGQLEPDEKQNRIYQADYKENQFGKWRFDSVLCDFRPDWVIDIRDAWMVKYQGETKLRHCFKWGLMACVDGHPQRPEWLDMYGEADAILTYSQYGKKVLESESAGAIEVLGVPSPGVDTDIFKPLDKAACKAELGIANCEQIIGTVMRNQQRKLYPRLILAFKELLSQMNAEYNKKGIRNPNKRKMPYLLLHTSIPDVGWDIPLEIKRNNLQDRVLFSYFCRSCKDPSVSLWQGETAQCKKCGANALRTPNTGYGFPSEDFAKLYSCMDLYVQTSVCEGFGMSIPEAKACGVPVLGSDWSAISEQVHAPGGIPLKIETTFTDHGTMQRRSLFSQKDFVAKTRKFFKRAADYRVRVGLEGRETQIDSWDKAAAQWVEVLENSEILDRETTWNAPADIKDFSSISIPNGTKQEKLEWMYTNILETAVDQKGVQDWLKSKAPFDEIVKYFIKLASQKNEVEKLRTGTVEKVSNVITILDENDTFRIVYGMPKTAGDILLSTAVVASIKEKYPEASIYFACESQYFDILKGNSDIHSVLEWSDSLFDYRVGEGFAKEKGNFDICYTPSIITQRIGHWLHNGHGKHLMDAYADMCGVTPGAVKIQCDPIPMTLPEKYITVATGSSAALKCYDKMQALVEYSTVPVVHIGLPTDPSLIGTIDLRGHTTFNQAATVIKGAQLHVGPDSFCGHVAAAVGTNVVTLFGSTFDRNCMPRPFPHEWDEVFGCRTEEEDHVPQTDSYMLKGLDTFSLAINPPHRGECVKPCHFPTCPMSKKCIDYIEPVDHIISILPEEVESLFSVPDRVKISAYCITLNAINQKLPFEQSIRNHLAFADEVIVVDAFSVDGTFNILRSLQDEFGDKLKLFQSPWNYDNPDMMGRQKSLARSYCTSEYVWQFDTDELLPEWQHDAVQTMVKNNPHVVLFDIPCVTFHSGVRTTNIKENFYKWRLSKNDPHIVHGVPIQHRKYDENGNMFFYRGDSDSCEYIWEHTGQIVQATIMWDQKLATVAQHLRSNPGDVIALDVFKGIVSDYCNSENIPCVYHYSWVDYARKANQEKFWNTMKRYYKADGGKPRLVGNKIPKPADEITESDLGRLTIQYNMATVFPLKIDRHPEAILDWAKKERWNQIESIA